MEVLEHIGTEESRDVLKALAQQPSLQRQTREVGAALQRLAQRAQVPRNAVHPTTPQETPPCIAFAT
jgi:predicted RecB family endonuclease